MNNVRFFATTKKERFLIRENSSLLYRQGKARERNIRSSDKSILSPYILYCCTAATYRAAAASAATHLRLSPEGI